MLNGLPRALKEEMGAAEELRISIVNKGKIEMISEISTDRPQLRLAFMKFVVRDLDVMMNFYTSVFSMLCTQTFETDDMIEKVMMIHGDGFALPLVWFKDGRKIEVGLAHGALGFFVSDVESMVKNALGAGATLKRSPYNVGTNRIAYIVDPEGRQLQLVEERTALVSA